MTSPASRSTEAIAASAVGAPLRRTPAKNAAEAAADATTTTLTGSRKIVISRAPVRADRPGSRPLDGSGRPGRDEPCEPPHRVRSGERFVPARRPSALRAILVALAPPGNGGHRGRR